MRCHMLCHCNHTTQGEMCASVRMEVSTATIPAATVQRVSVAPSVKWTTHSTCVSCSMPPEHEEQAALCLVCMATMC